jgi:hypothetical protein
MISLTQTVEGGLGGVVGVRGRGRQPAALCVRTVWAPGSHSAPSGGGGSQ